MLNLLVMPLTLRGPTPLWVFSSLLHHSSSRWNLPPAVLGIACLAWYTLPGPVLRADMLHSCCVHLTAPRLCMLLTPSRPSWAHCSIHFNSVLSSLEEDIVDGLQMQWTGTVWRAVAGEEKSEVKAQILLEQEETVQSGCSSLQMMYEMRSICRERFVSRSLAGLPNLPALLLQPCVSSLQQSRVLWVALAPPSSGLFSARGAAHNRYSTHVRAFFTHLVL